MLALEGSPEASPIGTALQFWPLVAAAIVFEIAWTILARRRAYPWREMLLSSAIMLARQPMRLLYAAIVVPVAGFAWSFRVATIPLDTWWGVALLFAGVELCYYWAHRAMHGVRWMWASHAVHHSPNEIHLASAYRLGVTDVISGGWVFYVPLYLIGFHPLAVIAIKYGLVHPIDTSNPLKLAFFEWMAMARDVLGARSWRERLHHLFGRPGAGLRLDRQP